MKKIILVDGNNLLFRSYYATAYNGNFMKNSKGLPTNALYGFTNMINKIINEEEPVYMIVAFDKGKTFRHDKYDTYKDGRIETPEELKQQFPIAKDLLTRMGIKYYEIDNYEADDIIGTFAEYCDIESEYIGTIISSDCDLLQLISTDIEVKLLKQKDHIRYNIDTFREEYGIEPINMIDLKALMGDSSDNIPGVKGIGEKTALKLLHDYKTLDGIYENIESIPGKLKEKLIEGKESAYMSYDLATIVRDVPVEINIDDIIYKGEDTDSLNELYEELEFYSFLKRKKIEVKKELSTKVFNSLDEIKIDSPVAVYLEVLGTNYHNVEILGMGIYNDKINGFIPFELLKKNPEFLTSIQKYTYDLKKMYVALKWQGINVTNVTFDTMIATSLLDYNVKDDIAYLAREMGSEIEFYENIYGKSNKLVKPDINIIAREAILKAQFIFNSKELINDRLETEELLELFNSIEMPLATVLGRMEYQGVYIDQSELSNMGESINKRIDELTKEIHALAECEFNIASPSQLGDILFDKLKLPHGKKGKTGYSTNKEILERLSGKHPIIDLVLEYRTLAKLSSTYVDGLLKAVYEDGKIHTIYTQNLTRTGRLSSIEPNLQNIPIRYELGKMIRKAFVPSQNSIILTSDYSQIELRILAHMANVDSLIDAFHHDLDIHTKTAADIFHINLDEVTSDKRRIAKAVNFGIVYGISSFGLSDNLNIPIPEAKHFIDKYFETYPGIKEYMDMTIKNAYLDGYVRTLFNRKRTIDELKNSNYMIRQGGERIALNTPIQGTSADIIKKAMIEIDQALIENKLNSKMILQVHDELIFDVLEDEVDSVKNIIEEIMINTTTLSVPLKVEIESGVNWYETK